MKFKTHNDKKISTCGTCLQEEIYVHYFQLKKVFGKPSIGDQYKTDAEWDIEFEDGTVATIYNYKDGINYLGKRHGTPKSRITNWHIGGHTKKACEKVRAALDGDNE
jgi:hypothetical protein